LADFAEINIFKTGVHPHNRRLSVFHFNRSGAEDAVGKSSGGSKQSGVYLCSILTYNFIERSTHGSDSSPQWAVLPTVTANRLLIKVSSTFFFLIFRQTNFSSK